MADGGWLVRSRAPIYQALNLAALLAASIGAALHDIPAGQALYACALLAVCSAPLLCMRQINDRYALLGLFMGCYFLFFGALDLKIALLGTDLAQPLRADFMTPVEWLILAGAASALIGYLLVAAVWQPGGSQRPAAEWPAGVILLVGLALWAVGMVASIYYQIYVVPTKLGFAAAKGLASMGPVLTLFVMLGQMVAPVGSLMIAYGYSKYGGFGWTALTVVMVAVQVVVGFIEDIKMQAIMAPALVIMTQALVAKRLSKGWIAFLLAFLVVAFPVFQAYRVVSGERGLDRAQALQRLDQLFEIAVSATDKLNTGRERAGGFLERSSSKDNVGQLLEHVGNDIPYLEGESLVAIPLAFVPRIIMPDKQDLSVGQLYGKVILKADSGVFISVSHVGELYWNFGWSGTLLGLLAAGMLMGYVGTRFSLENGVTLTRVLVLLVSAQSLCMGFGGTMPNSYVLWARGMAAIGLMHLCFARSGRRDVEISEQLPSRAPVALDLPVPRFPNLLR